MRRSGSEAHDRVLAVLQDNAPSLLNLARRHSLCLDDAQDAYQRALEIYLRRIEEVREASAGQWLRTVVKHEAMAIREARLRTLDDAGIDFDEWAAPESSSGEERAVEFERVTRAAEALQACKRDEVAAMVLRADGHSYDEICTVTGWTYTKVNRCLVEGRARFMKRYAAIEAGEECERLAPVLSRIVDGEASPLQMAEARPHLKNCMACRATLRELSESQPAIHLALPPAAIFAGTHLSDGFVSRVYELLFGGLQDRLALTAMKTQTAVEAVSATKLAAVAASAAAVAGGGAVAVERVDREPRRPAGAGVASKPPVPRPAGPRAAATLPAVAKANPRKRAVAPPSRKARAGSLRRKPRAEFGFEGVGSSAVEAPGAIPVAARSAAAERPRTDATSGRSRSGEDFGFER